MYGIPFNMVQMSPILILVGIYITSIMAWQPFMDRDEDPLHRTVVKRETTHAPAPKKNSNISKRKVPSLRRKARTPVEISLTTLRSSPAKKNNNLQNVDKKRVAKAIGIPSELFFESLSSLGIMNAGGRQNSLPKAPTRKTSEPDPAKVDKEMEVARRMFGLDNNDTMRNPEDVHEETPHHQDDDDFDEYERSNSNGTHDASTVPAAGKQIGGNPFTYTGALSDRLPYSSKRDQPDIKNSIGQTLSELLIKLKSSESSSPIHVTIDESYKHELLKLLNNIFGAKTEIIMELIDANNTLAAINEIINTEIASMNFVISSSIKRSLLRTVEMKTEVLLGLVDEQKAPSVGKNELKFLIELIVKNYTDALLSAMDHFEERNRGERSSLDIDDFHLQLCELHTEQRRKSRAAIGDKSNLILDEMNDNKTFGRVEAKGWIGRHKTSVFSRVSGTTESSYNVLKLTSPPEHRTEVRFRHRLNSNQNQTYLKGGGDGNKMNNTSGMKDRGVIQKDLEELEVPAVNGEDDEPSARRLLESVDEDKTLGQPHIVIILESGDERQEQVHRTEPVESVPYLNELEKLITFLKSSRTKEDLLGLFASLSKLVATAQHELQQEILQQN